MFVGVNGDVIRRALVSTVPLLVIGVHDHVTSSALIKMFLG